MKNSPLPTILIAVLLVVSLWSVGLCWSYINKTRELRKFSMEKNAILYRQNAINALVNDTIEYSKKNPNPAIDQILESINVSKAARGAQTGTNKPATTK
jgi:hypothetical protein